MQTFFGLVGGEVKGWCYRSLVFSQNLPSCTWVGTLIPAEELKDCYVHSLKWSEDPDQRLHHCFLIAPPLFLHSLPSLISSCWKLPFGIRASLVAQRVKHPRVMRETWVRSLGREDPLEKEMASHSGTLAWKNPMDGEACRLQSVGSQRVGHD